MFGERKNSKTTLETDCSESVAGVARNPLEYRAAFAVVVVVGALAIQAFRVLNARRKALEGGILSIHSCALVWHAVGAAHVRAMDAVVSRKRPEHGPGLKGVQSGAHLSSRLGLVPRSPSKRRKSVRHV